MIAPNRPSLVAGAAQSLKSAIETGEFSEFLPNVQTLSEKLCVSVPTVLAAVKILAQDGYVVARQGCITRVIFSKRISQTGLRPELRKIVLLGFGIEILSKSIHYRDLTDHLRKFDFAVETRQFTEKIWRQERESLSQNVLEQNVVCWLLVDAPLSVQKWFSDQNLPCLLTSGVADQSVALPDFEIDFVAIYRHCANQLLNLGHERIHLLLEKHCAAKNPKSIDAFVEMVHKRYPAASKTELVKTHDGTAEGCERVLERLFEREIKPTALFVVWVDFYILTNSWLQTRGYQIPKDVSLVCRDSNDTSQFLRPKPSQYQISPSHVIRQLVRALVAVVEKTPSERHTLVLPEFIAGESLSHPPQIKPMSDRIG